MNKISVHNLLNSSQSAFESMPIRAQYDLVEQLFMFAVRLEPACMMQVQSAVDTRASAWRQYEWLVKWLRPRVTGA